MEVEGEMAIFGIMSYIFTPCAYSPHQFFFIFKCLWEERSKGTSAGGAVGSEWELPCPHIEPLILPHPTNCCIFNMSLDSVSLCYKDVTVLYSSLTAGNR